MNHDPACRRARSAPSRFRPAAALLSAVLAGAPGSGGLAADGSSPALTISGDIGHFTDPGSKTYTISLPSLASMPQRNITTATDWTPKGTFSGPLLRDLLAKAGARGTQVKFYGADDYSITVPIADFSRYDVILAWRWNGKPLQLENYGPFWVMYPIPTMSSDETGGTFTSKLIWQVTRMEVR
ncbi:molybdopterin-dependent oxidoreductase [Chromobacterium sp. ASV23]|uniref:molybdopterin-dependent oxidoreductase n=1 Tax=Chromobacterium sp. ASV23 TaxID=2795110 RepID=UPI0018EB01C5|nr:molybdopterin-dependent oxidoreductase [Chromobacterium sp. ASV23]